MKKIISILLSFTMILSFSTSAFADNDFQSGSGTENDPYVITTLEQLKLVSSNADSYFSLEEDITEPLTTSLCGDGFTGNFDGNGHTITLAVEADDPDAMFSFGIAFGLFDINDGVVSDLNVKGYIIGSMSNVGAIAGQNSGTITGCTSSATVNFISDENTSLKFPMISVGGITGINDGTISHCSASGTVNVDTGATGLGVDIEAGGMVGTNSSSSVSDSSASGIVNVGANDENVNKGGLIGWCNSGGASITNCSASGDVPTSSSDDDSDIQGGLIGYVTNSDITISGCYATGNVTGGESSGNTRVGGLIGYFASSVPVSYCYATGNVDISSPSSSAQLGGLIGYMTNSEVRYSYSTGSVMGTSASLGGLIGKVNLATVTDCYWNTNTSGVSNGSGNSIVGTGLTTAQMTGTVASTNMSELGFDSDFTAMENTSLKWYYPQLTAFSGSNAETEAASLESVTLTTPALSALNVSAGAVSPNFSSDTTDYSVAVGNSVVSIDLTPSTVVSGATIKVNGNLVTSGSTSEAIDLSDVNNTITITVMSSDGTYRDYKLTVTKSVPVTGITDVPTTATAGTDLALSGTVAPIDATNKNITWSVKDAGTTGATISGSTLSTTGAGTVMVMASITSGTAPGTAYTQDFTIMVNMAASADKILTSVIAPGAITGLTNGTAKTAAALLLPSMVTLVADGENISACVAWDVNSCSYNESSTTPQTFTVIGTFTLPSGVVNTNNVPLTTSISVSVNAVVLTDKTLTSVTAPDAITGLTNGTAKTAAALLLPSMVTLVADGENISASVAWDVNSCSYNESTTTAQTFTVSGTVTLPSGVVNTNNVSLTTSISVSVNKASSSGGGNGSSSGGAGSGGSTGATDISKMVTVTTDSGTTTATKTFTVVTRWDGVASANMTKTQISEIVEAAREEAQKQNTQMALEIKVDSDSTATGVSVTIPQAAASSLTDGVNALTISSPVVTITFDKKALAEIGKNKTVDITITAQKLDDTAVSDEDKAAIGDRPIYDLKVTSGNTTISSFGGGTAMVSIPYTPAAGEDISKIVIYYISGSGELIMVPDCVYDESSGTVTFKTNHFSSYAVGYNDVNFKDVSGGYETYVNYLAARGIINGTGNGKFSPDANITRAEFVTILANLSGDDLDGYTSSSFKDVAATDWYNAAAQWAYKNGIASGYGGAFDPNGNITREQMAVILFNYAKYAGVDVSDVEGMAVREFSDYDSISNWAMAPIQWAINKSIVSGNSDGSFASEAYATRAQAAKMIALLLQGTVK